MQTQVAAALRALADQNDGRITAERVVDVARAEDSVFHGLFEWDDGKAAHQHRLDQARSLIRSVKVEITTTEYSLKAPLFVRDPEAIPNQGYATLATLKTNDDVARDAVIAEFSRAAAALARAKSIALALGISAEISEVHERVIGLQQMVQPTEPAT